MTGFVLSAMMALFALTSVAQADQNAEYPNRPVMMMVSFGAGGATDYQARILTKTAGGELGMPIAILNKPGAGGRFGWNWFNAYAEPDGYTLAAYNVPHFIAQSIEGGVKYGVADFEPVINWGADPAVLVVSSTSEFNTLQDVVSFAKTNPGSFTLSGAGMFVGHHIAALQMEKAGDISLAYAPFENGGAAAMKAVIAGEVMGGINNLSDAFRAREAGRVKIIAIADLQRNDFLPDVPTMIEAGLDVDDASVNYRGVMVPKGTPAEIIEKLAETFLAQLEKPDIQDKMQAGGAPIRVMLREEVKAMWAARAETLKVLLPGL